MTILDIGASVSIALGNIDTAAVATNGGSARIVVAPVIGAGYLDSAGPSPFRKRYGPIEGGATLTLTNISCPNMEYDDTVVPGGGGVTEFVQLTDAPASLIPNSVIAVNDAGDALINADWFTAAAPNIHIVKAKAATPDPDGNGVLVQALSGNSQSFANLYADDTDGEVSAHCNAAPGASAGLFTTLTHSNLELRLGSGAAYLNSAVDNDAGSAVTTMTGGVSSLIITASDITAARFDTTAGCSIFPGAPPGVDAGSFSVQCANADTGHTGGGITLQGSQGTIAGGPVTFISGAGSGSSSVGGDATLQANDGGTGGVLHLRSGIGTNGSGGDLDIVVGDGSTTPGVLRISAPSSNYASPNNGQAVTYDALIGPGGAAISIKRWIPITIDGLAGWIPHFGP